MRILPLLISSIALTESAAPTAREMIADATGKLEKLNKRSQKIYVEYLSDWPRQQNFIKKLQKMQSAISEYLTKCGYDIVTINKLESVWNVDLNRDGHISQEYSRKKRETLEDSAAKIEAFWEEFDEEMDLDDTLVDTVAFSLFGNDNGGAPRNEYVKIQKMFNGYEKFVKLYLSKCKKLDKIDKRVSKTNDRLIGAIDKYDRFLLKNARQSANKEAQDIKKQNKRNKKNRKQQKRISNAGKTDFVEVVE